jgi:hypothetical protein
MEPVDPVGAAHARLLSDRSIQFAFGAPPAPQTPPPWLRALLDAIGHALRAAGPAISVILWTLLIVGVVGVLAFLGWELFFAPGRRERTVPLDLRAGAGVADVGRLRALLADADALAAQGRYAEAVHVLLFRSIDEVEDRGAERIVPSLTSRDIAALPGLPPEPRAAFQEIAGIVEKAVFGGRPVAEAGWMRCRGAYERFAFSPAWGVA